MDRTRTFARRAAHSLNLTLGLSFSIAELVGCGSGDAHRAGASGGGGAGGATIAGTGAAGTQTGNGGTTSAATTAAGTGGTTLDAGPGPSMCQPAASDSGTCQTPMTTAETLVVDVGKVLGPVTHVASGGLEGLAIGTPPDAVVAPLHPKVFTQAAHGTSGGQNITADALKVAPQAAQVGASVEMRFADALTGFYNWPGWTQWLSLVDPRSLREPDDTFL